MKKTVAFFTPLFALAFIACNDGESAFQPQYFDVKSVIDKTIELNNAENLNFEKTVWVNGKKEVIETNKIDWKKELEIFSLADLNKRDYLNKFSKDSTNQQLTYRLKPNNEAQIKTLEIHFSNGKPTEIDAELITNNFLYDSERRLKIKFDNQKLIAYEVDGWQQLIVGDKKTYRLVSQKK